MHENRFSLISVTFGKDNEALVLCFAHKFDFFSYSWAESIKCTHSSSFECKHLTGSGIPYPHRDGIEIFRFAGLTLAQFNLIVVPVQ